jgi:hypothetical protein
MARKALNERWAYIFLVCAMVVVFLLPASLRNGLRGGFSERMLPLPTEERQSDHEKREKWIEDMHLAAPGVNWRLQDLKTRMERADRYNKNRSVNPGRSVQIAGVVSGSWQERGSKNQAGRIHLAELDTVSHQLYCASDGGQIWRTSTVGSPAWQVLTDHIQFKGIHFLKVLKNQNGLRILIATDQSSTPGFYYTDDTCKTWVPATGTTTPTVWGYLRRAVITGGTTKTIYLLSQGWSSSAVVRLLKSEDDGASFQEVTSFPETQVGSIRRCDIWTDKYGTGRLFMLKGIELYELIQGQLVLKSNFNTTVQNEVRLSGYERGNGATLYVMDAGSGSSDCYRSVNDGVTWSFRGNVAETPFMINSFACSATNPDVLYYGGVEAYRSPTAGINWYRTNAWGDYYGQQANMLHADLPGFCSFINNGGGEMLYICTDGGIYNSVNSMVAVNNLSLQGLNVSQYYSVYTSRVNTNFIHAGSQDQGYQRTNNTAGTVKSFDQIWSGDYGHIMSGDDGLSIWMNYPGFTVYYNDILYSTNRAWWEFTFENALWLPPMMIDPWDQYNVLIAGGGFSGGAHLIQVTYMGPGVPMMSSELPFDFSGGNSNVKISAVASSPLDKDCWYVLTTNGRFFHSPDAGITWTLKKNMGFNFGHYFYGADILPSPNEKGKVYICGSGYSNPPVFELTKYGAVAKPIADGLPETLVYAIDGTPDEGLLFAATEVGPYVFVSSQQQWYDLSEGNAPDQTWWSVDYIESLKTVRFGTYGRGIWDFNLCAASSTQPQAVFTSQPGSAYLEVLFQDQSTGNPFTWLWDFGDGQTSVLQSPTHIYTTPGSYNVRLITGNICQRDTLVKTIQVTQTGVQIIDDKEAFTLYPNPTKGQVYLKAVGWIPAEIHCYAMNGTIVHAVPWTTSSSGEMLIDLSGLPKGFYYVELRNPSSSLVKKILLY